MPASLFAVWAGRHAARVTTVAGVTGTADAAASLVVPPVPPVTDGDEDRVTGVTDQSATPDLVTPVTVTLVPWLRENREDFQTGNPRNPGNPPDWVEPWPFEPSNPASWQHLFRQRRRAFELRYPHRDTARLAYEKALLDWHDRFGEIHDPGRCAGCGWVADSAHLIDVAFGARAHAGCITLYRWAWRTLAAAGLGELGIDPPAGFMLLHDDQHHQ